MKRRGNGEATARQLGGSGATMTGLVRSWTGRSACVLQAALRMTNEAFAEHLGVAGRTVGTWHERPGIEPRSERQQLLDTALERASDAVKHRFASNLGEQEPAEALPDSGQTLRVAICVVVNDDDQVLMVQRRGEDGGGISWQFPAGMVKPGTDPGVVAVRETYAETGVHCGVSRKLGSRLHPVTNVFCDYLLCEYLTGEPENKDVVENVSVTWVDKSKLTRFVPAKQIFPPILEALEVDQ